VIEQSHEDGVFVSGSDATIDATVIRSTLSDAQGKFGRGIGIQDDPETKARANVTVHACLVEQNQAEGVIVCGSDAAIDATVVKGMSGRGIDIEDDPATNARANVTVGACLVEQNHEVGIFVAGSDTTIEATVVRSTQPDTQGESGRGIGIQLNSATNARA